MTDGYTGRPRKRFVASGIVFEIEQAPPRVAFKAILRIGKTLGHALSGLVSGAGFQMPDGTAVGWEDLGKEGALWPVVNALLERLHTVDPDEVVDLLEELAIRRLWVHRPEAQAPVLVANVDMLDALVPDPMALFGILRWAIEVNVRPTSPGTPAEGPGTTTP
jgi:hypothetical protein